MDPTILEKLRKLMSGMAPRPDESTVPQGMKEPMTVGTQQVLQELMPSYHDTPEELILRKPTGLPLTQNEPWADSLQTALGVRPSRTRYLPAPFGDVFPEGGKYDLQGLSYRRNDPSEHAIANEMQVRAGAPKREFQDTYAHELSHILDNDPTRRNPVDVVLRNGESYPTREAAAELMSLGWDRWSGRPVDFERHDETQGAGANEDLFTKSMVERIAAQLRKQYHQAK